MALKTSTNDDMYRFINVTGELDDLSVTKFERNKRRLDAKKRAIDDMQNEYNLLEKQTFETYKSEVNYFYFSNPMLICIRDWLDMQKSGKDKDGNKLDRRKHYKEETNAEYMYERIGEYLGIENFVATGFVDYNFSQAYEIVFEYMGHKWYLQIPNMPGIHFENFQRYGEDIFKLSLHHYDSEHCTSYVGGTFEEEELKDIMAKGIEKYCKEDKENE